MFWFQALFFFEFLWHIHIFWPTQVIKPDILWTSIENLGFLLDPFSLRPWFGVFNISGNMYYIIIYGYICVYVHIMCIYVYTIYIHSMCRIYLPIIFGFPRTGMDEIYIPHRRSITWTVPRFGMIPFGDTKYKVLYTASHMFLYNWTIRICWLYNQIVALSMTI